MRYFNRMLFAAAALILLFVAAPAFATGDGDYYTTYYDSSFNVVGTHREDCDHNETPDGEQCGAWKEVLVYSCVTYGYQYEYYRSCGCPNGGWRRVNYLGDTSNPC